MNLFAPFNCKTETQAALRGVLSAPRRAEIRVYTEMAAVENVRVGATRTHSRTVGIVGARGINNYGGYERMLVDLAPRLVHKGYRVRCSCEQPERGERPAHYIGVTLDYFPFKAPVNYSLRKAFELLYDMYFIMLYSLTSDTIYVLGIYGGLSLVIPRLLGREVVVNIDGLEWERAKYHIVERSIIILYYTLSLNLASKIVIDNEELKAYIGKKHHTKVSYIPYGASEPEPKSWNNEKLGPYVSENGRIESGKYWLLIARLEPENNIDVVIDGFNKAKPKNPMIVVGDFTSAKYRDLVYQKKRNSNSTRIIFLGATYDADVLWMLRGHCLAYIHGHSVGGTNPSLLEAMACGNRIVCHDNPFNREVCRDFAQYFADSRELSSLITSIEKEANQPCSSCSALRARATQAYSWDYVITLYDHLFADGDRAGKELAKTTTLANDVTKQN